MTVYIIMYVQAFDKLALSPCEGGIKVVATTLHDSYVAAKLLY